MKEKQTVKFLRSNAPSLLSLYEEPTNGANNVTQIDSTHTNAHTHAHTCAHEHTHTPSLRLDI